MKLTNNVLLLPTNSVDIRELMKTAGRSDEEITKTLSNTGVSSVRNAHPKLLTEFVFDGLSELYQKNPSFFSNVDGIIVVSQSYDQRIPSISTRIQSKFDIKSDAFCIDVMDGCSGYIKALRLAKMLATQGAQKILIVAGDLNSMMTSEAEVGTKILFGDGISISTLESDETEIETLLFNDGDHKDIISCSGTDNLMNMNGFEVFRFTRNVVPPLIKSFLEETGRPLDSYDLLALHQASKLVVSTICRSLNYENKHCDDFACGEIGNLGAGSIGAWLASISDLTLKGRLNMLAVGFGSGLSWGLASIVVDVQTNEVIYV